MVGAHVVKHSEGQSARELHAKRPDLVEAPGLPDFGEWNLGRPRVFQPQLGEDVYVTFEDGCGFRDELLRFWDESAEAIAAA